MLAASEQARIDERMMELIAARVAAALREDLEMILGQLSQPAVPAQRLTVEQVATRLGVARCTVYAHWREWGGYKLGAGAKAPIRFDANSLPAAHQASRPGASRQADMPPAPRRRRRRRRELIPDTPRLAQPLDGLV